ncbi:MAG: hypothetical protein GY756_23905, partial [bacterium]|nr:hypothetical protein [bacterium]
MKYIITITLLSLLNLLQAQNSSLSKQVDIFIEECKINKKELIYCNLLNEKYKTKVISSNDFIEINISKSDIENLESIVKYIENKYLNIMNPWVRKGIISICIKLIYCDSLKFQNSTKRKLVNICLNNSFLGTIISLKRVDKSYFNEIARNKLFDVLNQKYTKEEVIMDKLDDYRESVPADTLINNRIKNQYLKKAKKANLTVQEWCDSVNNDYKQKALNPDMNKYNPRISSSIITLIGNCHFTEYSQKLEEMLKNKEFSYLYDEILLVLAKLNYKNYSNLFFEKMIKREYKDEW